MRGASKLVTPTPPPSPTPPITHRWDLCPNSLGRALRAFWRRYQLPLIVTESGIADGARLARLGGGDAPGTPATAVPAGTARGGRCAAPPYP